MKIVGLVPPQNHEELKRVLKLPVSNITSYKEEELQISNLSVNITSPEYDLKNTASDLVAAVCISTEYKPTATTDSLGHLVEIEEIIKRFGAEVILRVTDRKCWNRSNNPIIIESEGIDLDDAKYGETKPKNVKWMVFVRRLAEITHDEFSTLWENHIEIAKEHHPGLARYSQNLIYKQVGDFTDEQFNTDFFGGSHSSAENELPFDGISEHYFDDISGLTDGMRKDETSEKILYDDINGFLDIPRGNRIFATEHTLLA